MLEKKVKTGKLKSKKMTKKGSDGIGSDVEERCDAGTKEKKETV